MEIEIADASGLPEALKPFVAEKGGKSYFDAAKVAADLDGWKSKTQTAQSEAIERRKALKAWEALGADPTEVQTKLAKGADPAIIDQMRKEFGDKEAGFKSRLSQIVTQRAVSDLKGELAKAGVIPSALDDIALVGRAMMQIDEEGDVRVVGADGKPMIGNGQNGGATLADLAKALASARPYAVADAGVGGGGKQPGSNGSATAKTMTRTAFDALDQYGRASFVKEGGKVID